MLLYKKAACKYTFFFNTTKLFLFFYKKREFVNRCLILQLIEDLSKYKIKNIGVDGCTLPNPLMPLKKFALAIAQLADYIKLNNHSAISKSEINKFHILKKISKKHFTKFFDKI